jgi:hypothetical protein
MPYLDLGRGFGCPVFIILRILVDSTSSIVKRTDVKTIAECYGTMQGSGSYDTRLDFTNNYRVDIADISTVASNM